MRLASRVGTYLVALSILALGSQSRAQVYQGKELVKAELLADANAIVPGKPFTIGLLRRMVPSWYTYWAFYGDAGLPTELKWKLPSGWKVGQMQWPIPLKTVDPGDIETYGYENEVLLMQEITPPQKLDSSRVKLSAEANWLVCEKICIPGSATPQLELPVSTTSQPANWERFGSYRRLLPQNWPESNVASVNWSRIGHDLRLKITSETLANYPALDFFPLPGQDVVVGHPRIESRNKNEVTFRVPIDSSEKNLSSIPGLIVFSHQANGEDRSAWQISATPTLSAAGAAPARGIFTFLLFGFLGGFILNLMPCVLPVISLKIFGFIQHAGQSRRRIMRSGLAFVAGIFAWFVGLALLLIILKSLGREITWAFQFTNPYFVLFMSAVVLVFALNLFGVFEISLPQSANRCVLR